MLTNALICVTSLKKSQEYLIKLIALKSKKMEYPIAALLKYSICHFRLFPTAVGLLHSLDSLRILTV